MTLIGWREWVALPALQIAAIKAKADTGARSSSLHAFKVETYLDRGARRVRFSIHPLQRRTDIEIACDAMVVDERFVTDSGGHRERRLVILTPVRVGDCARDIEITLARRDTMTFRMLLGRTALHGWATVDPSKSFLLGHELERVYRKVRPKTRRQGTQRFP